MNSFTPLTSAQQKRADYRRLLRERRSDVEAPTVPDMIAGDPDGLVLASTLKSPLKVLIPAWREGPSLPPETLTLEWAQAGDINYTIILEEPVPRNAEFPLELEIPVEKFIEGRRLLRYRVSSANEYLSADRVLTLDRTPPYGDNFPAMLTLDIEAITEETLAGAGGVVTATIPGYPDKKQGETAFLFWLKEVPDDVSDISFVAMADLDQQMTFTIDRRILDEGGDGDWFALYVLRDKAGNLSRPSAPVAAAVALGALPTNLKDPVVPLGLGDGIDRVDAFTGVMVEIPIFDGWKNGDQIIASWGTVELAHHPVGPSPRFPLEVQVPWPVLRDVYDFQAGGSQQVEVRYQVKRGSFTFPVSGPLSTQVQVNLEVIGPDNPQAPDPVNEQLAKVLVKGDSDREDELIQDDYGKDATAYISLYPTAKAGDLFWLYWNNQRIDGGYYLEPEDIARGEVLITVPWSIIEEAGNNTQLPVYYQITGLDGVNYQQSKVTLVDVQVEVVEFDAPVFPDIWDDGNGFRAINCDAIRLRNGQHGVDVHIAPDGKYLKAGVTVTFQWWVNDWEGWDENDEPIPGAQIPGTEFTAQVTLDATHETDGVDFFVQPYDTKIYPAFSESSHEYGISHARFSLIVGSDVVWSDVAAEYIILKESCDLP